MMQARILVVEDDVDIRDLIRLYLEREGFAVDAAASAEQGDSLLRQGEYQLLLTDIMLPQMSGMELARRVRSHSKLPIIFLTSKNEPQDIIAGLETGGDDYITKPFDPDVMAARVKAVLRRSDAERQRTETWPWDDGRLRANENTGEVSVEGTPAALSAKELQLLFYLIKHRNQVFSVQHLYERIWGFDRHSDERTVMVHIHHLRKKIEPDAANPSYIVTVRGFGYKFQGGRRLTERQ